MGFPFQIIEHVIEGQHIREYPRATATPDFPLKLCIKQYQPLNNLDPQPGDVTIVAVHGTGYPKELYEPLWEDLLAHTTQNGVRIRGIWIADVTNQGASGILNEEHLGNDPSSYDHSRDLIHMINCFRDQMQQPIMGIGHSYLLTSTSLFASIFHSRLFASLVFIEPHINEDSGGQDVVLMLRKSSLKRDIWPSRAEAIDKVRGLFKAWDARVFQRWTEFGYRDLPTAIYPGSPTLAKDAPPPVTLATTKYQETMIYNRMNVQRHIQLGLSDRDAHLGDEEESSPPHDALEVPDMLGPLAPGQQCYRPESILAAKLVPHIRPSVLYISGSRSPLCRAGTHGQLARKTGTGFGGSGGMPYKRVRHVVVEHASHSVPQERVDATASAVGSWMQEEVQRWRENQARIASGWEGRPLREKSMFPPEWLETMDNLPTMVIKSKI
ncbi:toxin biosynthesis protein [Aspergillus transmontanensis]|uniref:Toxin biosynthesis protein n=1 Tax=Aspergillus transmontanensis TaxID=1034304 RepID=A0A5N6VI45_9EURO|nr:toxin biosynthesis protein [Aspergillus transmontanensis]